MPSSKSRAITYDQYLDKTLGCWIGKSLGGIIGAPFEAHKILGDMNSENCWPREIAPNDDLDIQVVWLEALEERGPFLTQKDLVEVWQDRCWYNFAEYGSFLYNVQRGIAPPLSGRFNNEFHSESMGCPIRAEIWGASCPGSPLQAAVYARQDGELDHIDNSVWAEMFWAAAIAEAYFAETLEDALDVALSVVPPDSTISRIAVEIPVLLEKYSDWRRIWLELVRRYGNRDCSKVQINFAFTLLSLYKGEGDLKKTIVAAINCGWDSDCTAATAGALVGVLQGADKMPDDWMKRMGANLTCDVNAKHKTAPLVKFAEDTCRVGIEVMLSLNLPVRITDSPPEILHQVAERRNIRQALPIVTISALYPAEPVLSIHRDTPVTLSIHNSGKDSIQGTLTITAPGGVIISPSRLTVDLAGNQGQNIDVRVRFDGAPETVWDKNLLHAVFTSPDTNADLVFGLVGARSWQVYGPYWDAWDTLRSEVCPYRNDEFIDHPCHVAGCSDMMVHQCVRLDKPYLDETTLVARDLPIEHPFIVECGNDRVSGADLGANLGECCYYLVREIASTEPVDCQVNIGATGPVAAWIDGREVLRNERSRPWFFGEYTFPAHFDTTPRRIVVKCLRVSDEFMFSMCFIKNDVPGDKLRGVSYLIDSMGGRKAKL